MTILMYTEQARGTGNAPTFARLWHSPLGMAGTWEEFTPSPFLTDITSFYYGRLGANPGIRALLGQNGPQPVSAFEHTPHTPIAVSTDGGVTWTGGDADPAAHWPGLLDFQSSWNIGSFLAVTPSLVYALCQYPTYDDYGYTVISLLKSTDGGATFVKHTPPGINDQFAVTQACLKSTSGRLFIGRQQLGSFNATKLYRSDNNGDTWTEITLPSMGGWQATAAGELLQTATGRILCFVGRGTGGSYLPALYYSDDDGDTWTLRITTGSPATSLIPAQDLIGLFGTNPVSWGSAAVSGHTIVGTLGGGLGGGPPPSAFRPFVMSVDDGLTFSVLGSYSPAPIPGENGTCLQMTVADDGAYVTVQGGIGTTTPGDNVGTVWRGVVNEAETDIAWEVVYTFIVPDVIDPLIACNKSWVYNVGVFEAPPPEPEPPPEPAEVARAGARSRLSLRVTAAWRPR